MNLLADESVDRQIVERLRRDGHHVLYVAELDPGIADDIVLERATNANALLVTSDKDFGELIYRQGRLSSGVLLVRLAGLRPENKAATVSAAVERHTAELLGAFTVVSASAIRIRRP